MHARANLSILPAWPEGTGISPRPSPVGALNGGGTKNVNFTKSGERGVPQGPARSKGVQVIHLNMCPFYFRRLHIFNDNHKDYMESSSTPIRNIHFLPQRSLIDS